MGELLGLMINGFLILILLNVQIYTNYYEFFLTDFSIEFQCLLNHDGISMYLNPYLTSNDVKECLPLDDWTEVLVDINLPNFFVASP